MTECYAGMDVVVLASLWEGMPINLLESLAMARPTVATAVSGSLEIIEHGVSGLLAPPKNPRAIADWVLYLLDNPDKALTLGRKGRERVAAAYDECVTAQKTIGVYNELLVNG
jgi:glycosyltransferase involved in cell wall biosynthesis